MNDKNMIRLLALLVFISSSVAAFAFAALAYTFATGDVPFVSHSMLDLKRLESDRKLEETKSTKRIMPEGKSEKRGNEEFLAGFYKELEKERARIAEERKKLEDLREAANQANKDALAIQKTVEEKEMQVKELLKTISGKEQANVTDMQKLIAGMDSASGLKLLLALDQSLAARILYSMNKKVASQLVSQAMGSAKDAKTMTEITAKMQTLSDEQKGAAPK